MLPRDKGTPVSTLFTPVGKEGTPPAEIATISNMNLMFNESANQFVMDLYSVDGLRHEKNLSIPFIQNIVLEGPKGENVRFQCVFDDGAMVNAIDENAFSRSKHRLSSLKESRRWLRMADGRVVPSRGIWEGTVSVERESRTGIFEVFNSGGAWAALFGKPLLTMFNAVHEYSGNTIKIPRTTSLNPKCEPYLTIRNIQCLGRQNDAPGKSIQIINDLEVEGRGSQNPDIPAPALKLNEVFEPSLLTRKLDPLSPARVTAVQAEVTIGIDLEPLQYAQVRLMVGEYADCFALFMSEVLPVEGASHRLDIP